MRKLKKYFVWAAVNDLKVLCFIEEEKLTENEPKHRWTLWGFNMRMFVHFCLTKDLSDWLSKRFSINFPCWYTMDYQAVHTEEGAWCRHVHANFLLIRLAISLFCLKKRKLYQEKVVHSFCISGDKHVLSDKYRFAELILDESHFYFTDIHSLGNLFNDSFVTAQLPYVTSHHMQSILMKLMQSCDAGSILH